MGFWGDFRSFIRTRSEILDRMASLEREHATLRHRIDEVDEFVHVQSRKRYQEVYVPQEKETPQEAPGGDIHRGGFTSVPPPPPSKDQLRERARQRYGRSG